MGAWYFVGTRTPGVCEFERVPLEIGRRKEAKRRDSWDEPIFCRQYNLNTLGLARVVAINN